MADAARIDFVAEIVSSIKPPCGLGCCGPRFAYCSQYVNLLSFLNSSMFLHPPHPSVLSGFENCKQFQDYFSWPYEQMSQSGSGIMLFYLKIVSLLCHLSCFFPAFRQLVSGTLVVFRSKDCKIRHRFRLPPFTFLRHTRCSQTNSDQITCEGWCNFLLYCCYRPVLSYSRRLSTLQQPNQARCFRQVAAASFNLIGGLEEGYWGSHLRLYW